LRQRPDCDGEGDGTDADGAAEQPADREHGELQAGAREPDRTSGAARQAGHQPVPRPGAEVGADVHAGRHPAQHDSRDEVGDAPLHRVHVWQPLQA
jgi:hypothetical protein